MKIAVLFPGYGSQYVGMGKDFYKDFNSVRSLFKEASDYLDIDVAHVCFSAPLPELNKIDKAYLSIFVLGCSFFRVLKDIGIDPCVVAGYDTGQYAAVYAAGGFSFIGGLYLVRNYSECYLQLLQAGSYDIIKVNGFTTTKLSQFLGQRIAIAANQSRTQHLVSGTREGIDDLRQKLMRASKVTMYEEGIGLGLNSHLMDPVVEQFKPYLKRIEFVDLSIPLLSNVNAAHITRGVQMKRELIKVANKRLRWDKVVDKLNDVDCIIGVGAQTNILDLAARKFPDKHIIPMNNIDDLQKIKKLTLK